MMFDDALLARYAPPGAAVLLALSGGVDSCAALAALSRWCRAEGRTLAAAHLDHAIRAESADDARFCANLCARFGVRLHSRRVDVPALAAARRIGLEEAARDARYAFFAEVMADAGIGVLVTAHHADDNLETMLMRLTRGSGLRGLCGIPPVREFAGGVIVRPFLRVAKAEMIALCDAQGIAYRTDSTNADTAYTRNRIRAEVVPTLAALNPALLSRAADTADALRADEVYLADMADALHRTLSAPDRADAAWLRGQPTALRWRLYARMSGAVTSASLEQIHLLALDRLLDGDGGALSLPGRVTATLWGGELRFAPRSETIAPSEGWSTPAEIGWQALAPCCARVGIFPDGGENKNIVGLDKNIYKLFINRHLNFDTIEGYLHWRTRRPGDVLVLRGHHRSVKKLLQESRLPPADRARLPILCDDHGIVWLPGVALRDGADNGRALVAAALEKERIES
ncbi:MAG: tRNA lysidine(34) synthetase TilS [Clostridia bacterium]|nr:tRNA lysidine(34) synthetase TilS [Clostridia bacterium]